MSHLKHPSSAPFLGLVFILVGIAIALGFILRDWLPAVATEHGVGVDEVIHYLLVTTGIIFVVGHLFLGWSIFRSRRAEGEAFKRPTRRQEWIWAAVPFVLFTVVAEVGVIALGARVWQQLYGAVPAGALEIEAVGKQFEWFIRYPGKDGQFGATKPELVENPDNPLGLDEDDAAAADDVILGTLHLPEGRPVVMRLRTLDVLHSFSVPNFRIKQDLIPGFPTRAQFVATRPGEYELTCSELCGLGHYKMKGKVIVEEARAFDAWLARQKGWFQ